jgi:hypothetical protein
MTMITAELRPDGRIEISVSLATGEASGQTRVSIPPEGEALGLGYSEWLPLVGQPITPEQIVRLRRADLAVS